MSKRLGICIAGLNGAVASTVVAGLAWLRRGGMPMHGLISERYRQSHDLADWSEVVVGGWDPRTETIWDSARRHRVLDEARLLPVAQTLKRIRPMGGAVTARVAERHIEQFRRAHGLGPIVVINLVPTGEDEASASYAQAAAATGSAFVNFTPNRCGEEQLQDIPYAGRDGKTGQTWLKSVLAPALRARALHVAGWYSTNLLGNEDGRVVGDPIKGRAKIRDKSELLGTMLGYEPVHIVQIHYFPPRGDTKESWDYVEVEGFLGLPMALRISAQYRDSILAAPMCLDLARFMGWALTQGRKGPQTWLSMFFKAPYGTKVHEFERQVQMLEAEFARVPSSACAGRGLTRSLRR
ncbi:MAG: inositol-3-phosphate synthase [Verrucomicrobiae bacterium]|nr:inositol-3-phosphate synthase [Verrucomicrobiae bacterium]